MIRENDFLSDKQVDVLKTKLYFEKDKLVTEDKDKESFCLDKNELSDVLDEASVNIQTSKEIRFRNREIFYVKKINQAIDRVKKGTYGLCDECGGNISFERLNARPTAEMCIACKEEAECVEQGNFYLKKSKSLGKTINEIGKR
jgi:DnaK suppressor protein